MIKISFNCTNIEDMCTLTEIYSILARMSPPDIQTICRAGRLFKLAGLCVRVEEQWKRFMENPYYLWSQRQSQS